MAFSLVNGLSTLGTGVSAFAGAAGLDLQKSQLAQQSQILADQLATTRETKLQESRQAFESGQTVIREAGANTRNAATNDTSIATNKATQAGENARADALRKNQIELENLRLNAPSPETKRLREMGLKPDGTRIDSDTSTPPAKTDATDDTSTPAPTPIGDLGLVKYADGSVGTPRPKASDTSGTTKKTAPSPTDNPTDNPIVRGVLKLPPIGSEEDVRRATTMDVKNDPAWRDKSQGQQYGEVEKRIAVAKGSMTSPETQLANAKMIASYQIKEPDGFALSRPGAAETMAMVGKLNPDYQASRFNQVNDAMKRFGAEKEGDQVRYLDVGVQHMEVFDQAAKALGSGDITKLNSLSNWFRTNMGISAPTTLAGLKQIVIGEIQRAATGGIGSDADRAALRQSLDESKSPQQLQDMTNGFRALLTGQLRGLKRQYESSTGFKEGPFAFDTKLDPETVKILTPAAAAPSNPNIIRYDATGNRIAP